MGLLSFLMRNKTDPFAGRREELLKIGRITDGVIVDTETRPNGDEVVPTVVIAGAPRTNPPPREVLAAL